MTKIVKIIIILRLKSRQGPHISIGLPSSSEFSLSQSQEYILYKCVEKLLKGMKISRWLSQKSKCGV